MVQAGLVSPVMAAFPGTDVFLPMVGRNPGIYPSQWYTQVWVYNPGAAPAQVSFYLLERDKANTGAVPFVDTIQPGDTRTYENAVITMFGRNAWGALRAVSSLRIVVNARIYNQPPGLAERDTVGQDFAGIPGAFAIGVGEGTEILGVYQTVPAGSSEFRYNFGFVEVTGNAVRVRVTPRDETGAALAAAKEYQVLALSQRQLAFKDAFPGVSTENARLTVEPISGTGKVIAYGTGIANGTQDPTTFEMRLAEQLLGIPSVQHDGTLTGDGTAAAPLGLADAAVTLAKIGATNAPAAAGSAGLAALAAAPTRVLATDGTSLIWQSGGVGGLAAGGVTFGDASGGLAQDAPNLYWDHANHRLGLGTIGPREQLELTGNLRLPPTTAPGGQPSGVLLLGPSRFLHGYGSFNTFVGAEAGNLSTTGHRNAALGYQSLNANTAGSRNTALGGFALSVNTTGNDNTATGYGSLTAATTASSNTAIGSYSLAASTTGGYNTAVGHSALAANTTGVRNSAHGYASLAQNTTGGYNAAVGYASMIANTAGESNTASGAFSLNMNTDGRENTATGYYALRSSTTGDYNTAGGSYSLPANTTGNENTAGGYNSLYSNTTGSRNTAVGARSLEETTIGQDNTAVGSQSLYANVAGNENAALGFRAGYHTVGSGNVFLGARAGHDETGSNRLYIANASGTPLIYGQFDLDRVGINTIAPGQTLAIAGTLGIRGGGGYTVLQGSPGQASDLTYTLPASSADGVLRNKGGALSWEAGAAISGAGGTGQVAFWTGPSALSGSASLFWDSANSRLGLGTAAPSEQLELTGNLGLPATAASGGVASAGTVTLGAIPFLHAWGDSNTFLGVAAGNFTMSGAQNTALGVSSLASNTTGAGNTANGVNTLDGNTTGGSNTAVGFSALRSNISGSGNTALGYLSLYSSSTPSGNTAVGYSSLYTNASGERNTAVGRNSLELGSAGSYNTAVGYNAGRSALGSRNVFLGAEAGTNETGSNRLHIANASGTPLVYGQFDAVRVGINTTSPGFTLDVNGSAGKTGGGSWSASSDARLKRDIQPLTGALEKLLQLEGVSFEWVNPEDHGGAPRAEGFVAQDVERVFPEWVGEVAPAGRDRELVGEGDTVRAITLPFAFDAYLVEAIKEQQREIESQRARIEAQAAVIAELAERLAEVQLALRALKKEPARKGD
jgi:hypothetical protein